MAGNGSIVFGIKCQKGVYKLPFVKVIFTLLNASGQPIAPLTQLTAVSDANGKAQVRFGSVEQGEYKIKGEISINEGCGIKYVISNQISIRGAASNSNCYRWDIYTYTGELVKSGTSQPDNSNTLITYIDYTGVAPGDYKIKIWDCEKSCDSNLKNFTLLDNSIPTGSDFPGWKEVELT